MERATLLRPEAVFDSHTLERLCQRGPSPQAGSIIADGNRELLDERVQIRQALSRAKGKVMGAARLLGLNRSALRYCLRRYGSERPPQPSRNTCVMNYVTLTGSAADYQADGWLSAACDAILPLSLARKCGMTYFPKRRREFITSALVAGPAWKIGMISVAPIAS
jgi:Bacterial regulatory protein, Fis family